MRRALASLSVAALLTPAAMGQTPERFELYNACRPVKLVVERLSDRAAAIGLTKQSLQAAAESRLRAARLYTEALCNRILRFCT